MKNISNNTNTTSYYSGQYANDYYDSNSAGSHYTNQIMVAMAAGAGCVNIYLGDSQDNLIYSY